MNPGGNKKSTSDPALSGPAKKLKTAPADGNSGSGDDQLQLLSTLFGIPKNPEESSDSDDSYEDDDPMMIIMPQPQTKNRIETSLSPDLLENYMNGILTDVNEVLQLPSGTVRILLNYFAWNRDQLMNAYYDDGEHEIFKRAGILPGMEKVSELSASSKVEQDCQICYEPISNDRMHGMKCGHHFCKPCWSGYLTCKIMEEGICNVSCPALDCPSLVSDEVIDQMVIDPEVKCRKKSLVLNNFVEMNKLLKWCPSPGCENAYRLGCLKEVTSYKAVQCHCGHRYCFDCGSTDHNPINCDILKKWLKKCQDDSETANWIAVNTKECPKCHTTIEKNGGCNQMTCRKPSCRNVFCWICLETWTSHSYNCNQYKESIASISNAKADLKRYLFYFNRYNDHMQSIRFESQLITLAEKHMEALLKLGSCTIFEVQFLQKAVNILIQCRHALAYSSPFAFYMDRNNQTIIFEDNQKNLQSCTENLSEYLERHIRLEDESAKQIETKVLLKSNDCERRLKALVGHVQEGYQRSWWTMSSETATKDIIL